VKELSDKLEKMHFDAILVSPAQRALNTILPYLQKTNQKAEIWPELAECCWQRKHDSQTAGKLILTSQIVLTNEQKSFFTFRDADSMRNYSSSSYADGVAHVQRAEELLRQNYFDSGKTVLIVAHYHSGQVLLADLLGITPDQLPRLQNAKITHLHQGKDGHFTLLTINGREVDF
jgi:broad specificity phosphatase PhoE